MTDVPITNFLASLGLVGENATLARLLLEGAGLTNPRKQRISVAKLEDATRAVDREIARLCWRCADDAGDDPRRVVEVRSEACARCAGSANARALDDLVAAAERAGVRRIVVVGGSPDVRRELNGLGDRLELRLVDGTKRRMQSHARRDVEWADVVVIAGASELAHGVSALYTRDPAARGKIVTSSRRGVEAIATAVVRHLERRSA